MRVNYIVMICLTVHASLGAGCERKRVLGPIAGLEEPEQMTLYSIDGKHPKPKEAPNGGEKFHNYPVFGKVEIKDAAARKEICAALKDGMARNRGTSAACFIPRHAIRAVEKGKIVDFVICFECYNLQIHMDTDMKSELITEHPQALLNQHLQGAGVPLAPAKNEKR